ncbi:MAG TPA: SDR family oxidoreductase, partial [Candidatus Cybelea sp.]
ISFNAMGVNNETIIGVPLVDLDVEKFSLPISAYTTTYFLTARAAAKHMIPNKSGVIMSVSALPGRVGSPLNGGYGPAMAAKEQMTRDLSMELAPHGIRVVGLRPHGIPDSNTIRQVFEAKGKPAGTSWEHFQAYLAGSTHARRVMTLDELANAAAFVASDNASAMTGTTVNLTLGALAD